MKLMCVTDRVKKKKGIPLINRTEVTEKISGLTEGNTYTGVVVAEVEGSTTTGTGSISTYARFLVFDDNKEWKLYHTNFFAPGFE